MSTFADSYASGVLFASPAPGRVFARRWRQLPRRIKTVQEVLDQP
jgi:hypothetical protein